MLKVFRDNLKKLAPILWAVIAVFILLVFVDFGTVNRPGSPRSAAASVGDYEVSWAEFQRRYEQTERQYREQFGDQYSAELSRQLQIPRQVIEQLLNNRVLLAEARRTGLTVTDAEVRERILDIPGLVDANGQFIDQETYERFAQSNGYSGPGDFENAVRESLLVQKLFDVMAQNVHVTDAEVEEAYREEVERATVRYVQVPRSQAAAEVEATQEQLQSWYEQHQEELRRPEQRVADYLIVDKALLRAQLEIPEEELRAYYEENPDEFAREEQVRARHILLRTGGERSEEEARTRLEEIRGRIEGGEEFAAVAREVSEDPGTKEQGGDLGFFGRGRMTPEFEEAAFSAETGELVGPVTTPFGVHLIQVEDRRAGGQTPFEEARSTVRGRIAAERVEQEAAELAADLREELAAAAGEGEQEPAARMQSLAEDEPAVRFASTQPFGRTGLVTGIGRAPELTEAAFALEPGQISDGVVSTPRGPTILLLQEVREPQVPPLSEVEARVRREVERELQQERVEERLADASDRLRGGASLDEVAEELGVQVQESGELGAGDPIEGLGADPALTEAALSAEEGEVLGPLATNQGAVLMEVTERKGFDAQELAERRPEIRARLEDERANQLLSSIVQKRREEMQVNYSQMLVEEFDLGGRAQT